MPSAHRAGLVDSVFRELSADNLANASIRDVGQLSNYGCRRDGMALRIVS
jgi:hypothetical protein